MLQQFVASWLRQQAQEALREQLERQASPEGPPPADVLLVFPSAGEAGGTVDLLADLVVTRCEGYVERVGRLGDLSVAIIELALPWEQLAPKLHELLVWRQPSWVLACGFARALQPEIRVGDVLMVDRVVAGEDFSLQTGLRIPATNARGLHVGALCSEPDGASHHEQATAADRQAAVVAEVCRVAHCKMFGVYIVAQAAGQRAPGSVTRMGQQESLAAKLGAAAGMLLDQPGEVLHWWADKEQTLKLSDRLGKFLVGVVEQLDVPPRAEGDVDQRSLPPQ